MSVASPPAGRDRANLKHGVRWRSGSVAALRAKEPPLRGRTLANLRLVAMNAEERARDRCQGFIVDFYNALPVGIQLSASDTDYAAMRRMSCSTTWPMTTLPTSRISCSENR